MDSVIDLRYADAPRDESERDGGDQQNRIAREEKVSNSVWDSLDEPGRYNDHYDTDDDVEVGPVFGWKLQHSFTASWVQLIPSWGVCLG